MRAILCKERLSISNEHMHSSHIRPRCISHTATKVGFRYPSSLCEGDELCHGLMPSLSGRTASAKLLELRAHACICMAREAVAL